MYCCKSTYHRVTSRQHVKKTSGSLLDSREVAREQKRKMSDPDIVVHAGDCKTRSQPIAIPSAAVSPVVSPHTDGENKIFFVFGGES